MLYCLVLTVRARGNIRLTQDFTFQEHIVSKFRATEVTKFHSKQYLARSTFKESLKADKHCRLII